MMFGIPCGWEFQSQIPSSSTFSRAFNEFAIGELPQKIHEAMIKKHYGQKLAGHISRDSTAIESREKPVKTPKKSNPKRKRGRPRKGEVVPSKLRKRVALQAERDLEDNLNELPTVCNVGTKKNSKGYKTTWIGYKLHLDCVDGDIPVSVILTSASLHDSQAAIPLTQMSSERVSNLYDHLMDAAYDSPEIHAFSKSLGHCPIIDNNPRRGEKILMDPAMKFRFAERSSAERVNSYLKDNYGGRSIRVKGASKVMTHLMFGIVSITAMQLYRLLL
jgi:hypothetical protein